MMAAFDPGAPPFWEKRRGDGPVMRAMADREQLLDREQNRKLRLLDPRRPFPHLADEEDEQEAAERAERLILPRGTTYAQRRELGVCQGCKNASPETARCPMCRERFNAQRRGRQIQWPKKRRGQ